MAAAAFPGAAIAQETAVRPQAGTDEPVPPAASSQAVASADEPDAGSAPATSQRLKISFETGAEYNDNIFATRNGEVDDVVFSLSPSAEFTIADRKSRLTFSGSGEIGRYLDQQSEDFDDWQIGFDGRSRVSQNVTLVGGGDYRWNHESRASPEAVSGARPTTFQRAYGFGGVLIKAQPASVRLVGTVNRLDYGDVETPDGTINNDDRDRTQFEIGTRVGYAIGTGSEIFIQGGYDKRTYDQARDDFGFDRNSDGFALAAGLRRALANRLSGEVFAGYLQQNYRDPRYEDIATIDLGAALDWQGPAGLSASFQLDRSVEETTLPGAASYLLTSGSLSVRADPHPRLSAGLGLRGSHYDYRGVDRSESVISANLWARYYLNRYLFIGTDYTLAERSSNAAGFDYDQNRVMLRIGAQSWPAYENGTNPIAIGSALPGGPYVAVTLGHGALITGLDGPRGPGTNTADFGDAGASYGGALGYGVLAGRLYLGIEAQGQRDGPDWLHTAGRVFSLEQKDSFGVSGRIGYAGPAGNIAYARAGVASTRLRTTYLHSDTDFVSSDRLTGPEFGVGIDAAAGKRGFVRMEYALSSYGDVDVPTGEGNFDNFSSSRSQFLLGGGVRFGSPANQEDEPARTDFSGFYIGAQFGHTALASDNVGTRSGDTAIDIQRASQGPMVGVYAGAGAVLSGFYLGAEIDADVTNTSWNIERDPTGRVYSARHDYSFATRARAGYQIGKAAMIYGHAGVVRTRFAIPYSTTNTSVRSEKTQTGLRYGVGMEIGLGTRARMRVDYSLTDYRRYDVEVGSSVDGFDHGENLFRVGLSWKL